MTLMELLSKIKWPLSLPTFTKHVACQSKLIKVTDLAL